MAIPMDDEHVNMFLRTHRVGRLGLQSGGRVYVVPITYVFDEESVYFHTNPGMKLSFLHSNPDVCFEVDDLSNLDRWQSVILWGRAVALDGEQEVAAMDLMIERLGEDGPEAFDRAIKLGPVSGKTFRIDVSEKTGRYDG